MPVDDATVRAIISAAMANPGNGDACCGRVEVAFRSLQRVRRVPGASLDSNVAAAEHYLFARWMVCTGWVNQTQMKTLVIGYDAKKWIDRVKGDPNAAATTSNPVSPPDMDVVRWGLTGVQEGALDHARCNSSVKPPLWRKLEEVLGPGRGFGPY